VIWYAGNKISEEASASFFKIEESYFEDGDSRFLQNTGTSLSRRVSS
jgi:hypothetical protein